MTSSRRCSVHGRRRAAHAVEIARDLVARLVGLVETDAFGRRPSHGSHPMWIDEAKSHTLL